MYYKYTILIIFLCSCFSCKNDSDDKLIYALKNAGNNSSELQKVLDHYKGNTLKLKAAHFLIENMPYQNYYESKKYDQYKKLLRPIMLETGLPDYLAFKVLTKRLGNLSESDFHLKNDTETITADYLIKNIDLAFKTWEEQPWGKYISFESFCQDILPYRIGKESIEDWRELYYNYFQSILDSLQTDDSPLTACQLIYDEITKLDWAFTQDLTGPHIGGKSLFEQRLGNCREYSNYMLYAMRAVGICGGIDLILQNPNDSYQHHYWNYMTDSTGEEIMFELYKIRPEKNTKDTTRLRAKIYRSKPFIQKESLPILFPNESLPKLLNSLFIIDVSEKYFPNSHVSISVDSKYVSSKLLYLCIFDNSTWTPITATPIKNNKAYFNGIEANIVYCPCLYDNGYIQPVTNPFLYKGNGEVYFFNPDTTQKREALLTRKFYIRPSFTDSDKPVIYGGEFQAANNKQFKKPITLYTITEEPTLRYKEISVNCPQPFKYIRYQSPDSSFCSMAEIEFYAKDSSKLEGKVIGTEGSFQNLLKYDKITAFDGDPITCYWSRSRGNPWIGLELEKPEVIKKIRYLCYNDDNEIREGDLYELFYFDVNKGFISLGKQYGNRKQALLFKNTPDNAILWLKDYTRGKEERIFTYENNKQVWW